MIKHICTIFLYFIPCVFAHTADTLYADTSFVVNDSLQTVTTDTTLVTDSLTTLQKVQLPDTLVPITVDILSRESTVISRETFLFTAYRYTGDLMRPFAFSFIKDLGFIGQPHETFIYGVGNRGISYLQDGILWNNRYTNSLDLNFVQSEDIDSIEIVPSPRGFLYGPYNNPVAVNFIMRDFLSPEPYSRLRYYEGPNGEAMIDGKFNAQIAKRWDLSFQVSNRSVDETYKNTDYSNWQANVKLKYFLSNSINITGLYSFVKSSVGLNGGIDIDSVCNITGDVNSIIYEPLLAPVVYPNRTMEVEQHNFGLRTLARPFDNSKLNLSFYYHYWTEELKDVQDTLDIAEDIETKSYGALLNYSHRFNLLTFQLTSTYEKNITYDKRKNSNNSYYETYYDYLAFGGVLTLNLLDGKLKPSVFYKYFNLYLDEFINGKSGVGLDIKYEPIENISFYAGYSSYSSNSLRESKAAEVGGRFNNFNLLIDLKYFGNEFDPYDMKIVTGPTPAAVLPPTKVRGFGLNLNYKLWLILMETNTSYYFNDKDIIGVPELQFVGGLYLKSKFFDDNLNLKSGFTFYYTGKRSSYSSQWGIVEVEPSNKIDFILIGEIQELAIVYFIWENLLGNQYFITPYYPMPERSIRFGLSWELFN
jgi:hypothetical protein